MAEGRPDQPSETHSHPTPASAGPTGDAAPATTPQTTHLPALPQGWEYEDPGSFNTLLICPHGVVIEQDGCCPEGCVSPWLRAGLI